MCSVSNMIRIFVDGLFGSFRVLTFLDVFGCVETKLFLGTGKQDR